MGVDDGAASVDGNGLIAQIFLSKYGEEAYDQWVAHEIPWTDPRIKDAAGDMGYSLYRRVCARRNNAVLATFRDATTGHS